MTVNDGVRAVIAGALMGIAYCLSDIAKSLQILAGQ